MDDRLYWIWLQRVFAPASPKADMLLREFITARAIYQAPEAELAPYKLTQNELDRLKDKSLEPAGKILSATLEQGGWILTPEDALYPSLLRAVPGLPLVIYGRGELPSLDILPAVAIVGTRQTTGYGRRATALMAGGLALGGAVIISGGACGVDTIAHEAAIAAGGLTVAVQGCGLDVCYPRQNSLLRENIVKSGAVISEYPPGTPPLRHHFPLRNRLISGMSLGVCVTEAPKRSGALITAHHAFEQGRDVFAVAGDMLSGRSEGTDDLIRQGARLVTSALEVIEEYLPRFPDILDPKAVEGIRLDPRFRSMPDTAPQERQSTPSCDRPPQKKHKVAECPKTVSEQAGSVFRLLGEQSKTLGELIELSGLSAPGVMSALTELELNGVIRCNPGQAYCLRTE
ncbi:MAG: DNA-processing protein DprA [Oscillospiraceae bacterium]|nr:DNA-processing protein DprA [Oscillospiraceae bacterium]MDD3833208.1 DNA-processing protein DprA [Oscillospiraceae bacterium]